MTGKCESLRSVLVEQSVSSDVKNLKIIVKVAAPALVQGRSGGPNDGGGKHLRLALN